MVQLYCRYLINNNIMKGITFVSLRLLFCRMSAFVVKTREEVDNRD